jgi:hypothetical protein
VDQAVVENRELDDGRVVWSGEGCGRTVSFTCSRPALSRTLVCLQDGEARDEP